MNVGDMTRESRESVAFSVRLSLSLSGVLAVPPDMRVRPLRPDEEEAPVVGRGRRRVHTGRGEQALHGKHLSFHGGLTLS